MRIGNIKITWHTHKWEMAFLHKYQNEHGDWIIEIGEKCKGGDHGYYNSTYSLYFKSEPPELLRIK